MNTVLSNAKTVMALNHVIGCQASPGIRGQTKKLPFNISLPEYHVLALTSLGYNNLRDIYAALDYVNSKHSYSRLSEIVDNLETKGLVKRSRQGNSAFSLVIITCNVEGFALLQAIDNQIEATKNKVWMKSNAPKQPWKVRQ